MLVAGDDGVPHAVAAGVGVERLQELRAGLEVVAGLAEAVGDHPARAPLRLVPPELVMLLKLQQQAQPDPSRAGVGRADHDQPLDAPGVVVALDVRPADQAAHAVGQDVHARLRVGEAQVLHLFCKERGAIGDGLVAGVAEARDLVPVAQQQGLHVGPFDLVAIQPVDQHHQRTGRINMLRQGQAVARHLRRGGLRASDGGEDAQRLAHRVAVAGQLAEVDVQDQRVVRDRNPAAVAERLVDRGDAVGAAEAIDVDRAQAQAVRREVELTAQRLGEVAEAQLAGAQGDARFVRRGLRERCGQERGDEYKCGRDPRAHKTPGVRIKQAPAGPSAG